MTQNVNCGLWVMTYQCRLISYNKCIILLGDVDSWGGYIYMCVCVCVCVCQGVALGGYVNSLCFHSTVL